jgi:asparaginyl-tRNA synthetase
MFTDVSEVLTGKEGKFSIHGWLHGKRSSGGIQFLIIRDGTGFIQCTLKKDAVDKKTFEEIEKLPVESALEISGAARKESRAPYGYELAIEKIKVLSKAQEDFPISKKYHGPDFLLDHRHLWLRSKKMHLIMKIRAKVLEAAREWFKSHGYLEVQVPTIVGAACEGGSTLFELKYFDRKAYLTQSWQLYGEAMVFGFGRCYTIAPSFRAEKSRTRRHLTEYWHLEAEMPFCGFEELMKIEEEFVTFIVHKIVKECEKELKELGRDPKELLKVKTPFPRVRYEEAIEILQKKGVKIKYGEDMGADEERVLALQFDSPFFVTHFPKGIKAFYHKPDPEDPKVTLSVDMMAPEGYGEIIGSGERIESYEDLMKRIKEEKLDPRDYAWYLDLRKFGSVQHAGFGLGIERIVMWICKLKHIRDAVAFPRLINRIYP